MNRPIPWRFLFRHPAHFFALGFGSGLSPVAPGTAGSLAALPLYLALETLLPRPARHGAVAAALVLGVWFCEVTGKALGEADPGAIVWDEIAALWLLLAFIPAGWAWWGGAFLLFRLFDIWKPFPIRQLDRRTHGGLGVMLDDVLAAGYAWVVLALVRYLT